MAQYYTLAQRGISSFSVDGVEHRVDSGTGLLMVEVVTPNLAAELKRRGAALAPAPANGAVSPAVNGETISPITGNVASPARLASTISSESALQAAREKGYQEGWDAAMASIAETSSTGNEDKTTGNDDKTTGNEDKTEREQLLAALDTATGTKVDRRKSLAQLRAMKAELDNPEGAE